MTAERSNDSRPPLDGLRVLDLSRVLAGPYCTMLLADLGAEVTKVERPGTGDDTRSWGPPFVGDGAESTYFYAVNRNKTSVVLDLQDGTDLQRARQLISEVDVVVENFRGGVLTRLGLDLAELREAHPQLITASIPAYNLPAKQSDAGYDLLVQATSGLMSLTGAANSEPMKVGVAMLDVIAGLHTAVGILAALQARERDGVGQHVQVGLFDAAVSALVNQAAAYLLGGVVPGRQGNAHPSIVPYQLLQAADAPFVLAGGNDKLFAATCAALDLAGLSADPRFATNADRVANRDVLVAAIEAQTLTQPAAVWLTALERHGVPAGPVRDLRQVFDSPEGAHTLITVEDPAHGRLQLVGPPLRLSRTPTRATHTPPPALGG